MFEVGRVCVKLVGRESAKVCVVVEKIDKNFVLVDGNVRRRKCNVDHLQPTPIILKISKSARTDTVHKLLEQAGFKIEEKKPPRPKKDKPVRKRVTRAKEKESKPKKEKKKPAPKKKEKTKSKKKPAKKESKPKKKATKKPAKKAEKKTSKKAPAKKKPTKKKK